MSGLEGVIAADTVLSHVDGENGDLIVRGHTVDTLANTHSFESMIGFLWRDLVLPNGGAPDLKTLLGERRKALFRVILQSITAAPFNGTDADISRGLAVIPVNGRAQGGGADVFLSTALDLAAALPVAIACSERRRQGLEAIPPQAGRRTAEDYLFMLTGRAADPVYADALDTYLVTVADHGMNASTFTARVVASTGADLPATILAAYGALSGPLHGGAPGPVLDMLDAIKKSASPEAWLDRALAAKERLMGFGHRVYRTRDPRADILKNVVAGLLAEGDPRLQEAAAIEAKIQTALRRKYPNRVLDTNVEFYTALLLDSLQLPRTLFTPTFAIGRLVGWIAHAAEQRQAARLIRPASRYTGEMPAERPAA